MTSGLLGFFHFADRLWSLSSLSLFPQMQERSRVRLILLSLNIPSTSFHLLLLFFAVTDFSLWMRAIAACQRNQDHIGELYGLW